MYSNDSSKVGPPIRAEHRRETPGFEVVDTFFWKRQTQLLGRFRWHIWCQTETTIRISTTSFTSPSWAKLNPGGTLSRVGPKLSLRVNADPERPPSPPPNEAVSPDSTREKDVFSLVYLQCPRSYFQISALSAVSGVASTFWRWKPTFPWFCTFIIKAFEEQDHRESLNPTWRPNLYRIDAKDTDHFFPRDVELSLYIYIHPWIRQRATERERNVWPKITK